MRLLLSCLDFLIIPGLLLINCAEVAKPLIENYLGIHAPVSKKLDTLEIYRHGYDKGLMDCKPDTVNLHDTIEKPVTYNWHYANSRVAFQTNGDSIYIQLYSKADTSEQRGRIVKHKIGVRRGK